MVQITQKYWWMSRGDLEGGGDVWQVFNAETESWVAWDTLTDEEKAELNFPPGYDPDTWVKTPGGGFALRGAADDVEWPAPGGDDDNFVIDNDQDGVDDREQVEEEEDGGVSGHLRRNWPMYAQSVTSPFAQLAPWAAWNALPNMIAQLGATQDYWLTKNQKQMLDKSKLWTALRMMGMITSHDYDPETGEYTRPGGGVTGTTGPTGPRGPTGGDVAGAGVGPSSVVNIRSSPDNPTYAQYDPYTGVSVGTASQGSFPQMAQSAFAKLRSGIGGTGPLNDILSQGLTTAGNQARTGVVEPALMAGQADTQAARDAQIAKQTIAGGQFASGLGQQQEELGLSAYETQMRKQLGLVGPMMQYMNPLQQSLIG
jgi:hypothetical protein